MPLLVLDNYDSFTFNLVHLLRMHNVNFEVHRNDKITTDHATKFNGILLSPGPGIPKEAGNMPAIIQRCAGQLPILGICLGHQAIAEHLGGNLVNMPHVYHGIQTSILSLNNSLLFENIPEQFNAGRYHSWEVSQKDLPTSITITAVDEKGSIMALENKKQKLFGLQFHPESIMTPDGGQLIQNFLTICNC